MLGSGGKLNLASKDHRQQSKTTMLGASGDNMRMIAGKGRVKVKSPDAK